MTVIEVEVPSQPNDGHIEKNKPEATSQQKPKKRSCAFAARSRKECPRPGQKDERRSTEMGHSAGEEQGDGRHGKMGWIRGGMGEKAMREVVADMVARH